MSEPVRIRFENVAKRYDARVVLRGLSGCASPGEVLTLTGPNGSGKSTLLAILCGLLRPTRGTVEYLDGAEELTAMENLLFYARVRGLGPAVDRCRECLEMVGLDPDRETEVRGYSTGMLQRVKIAQAVLHRPPVLFLDEPSSNLDPRGQDWLEGFVQRTVGEGATVVLATNDRREMTWGTTHVALTG